VSDRRTGRLLRHCGALLLAVFALTGNAAAQAPAHRSGEREKVVYHIDFDDKAHQINALRNIQNHLDATGIGNIKLVVVLHGDGLSMLLEPEALSRLPAFKHANADQDMIARVDVLRQQGVEFKICANSMRRRGVDPEMDLYQVDPRDIVPNGIAELARLQLQGYAYVKP
jgi:uncharacterized protein